MDRVISILASAIVDVVALRRVWDRIKPIPRTTTDIYSEHNPKIGALTDLHTRWHSSYFSSTKRSSYKNKRASDTFNATEINNNNLYHCKPHWHHLRYGRKTTGCKAKKTKTREALRYAVSKQTLTELAFTSFQLMKVFSGHQVRVTFAATIFQLTATNDSVQKLLDSALSSF